VNKKLIVISLIIIFLIVYSCGSKQPIPLSETSENQIEPTELPQLPTPTRAELIMNAFYKAFPDKIERIEFRNDDWAVLLKSRSSEGIWYYFAEGRILPQEKLENLAEYRALSFYNYPAELPPWTARTPEEVERFRAWGSRRPTTLRRSSYFLDDLWLASTRIETESRLVRISFLGRNARVHQAIAGKLALVEAQIQAAARTNIEVRNWITDIGTFESYGWRNIANSQSRSYHSYGLALDLLPRSLGRRQTYWLWTSQYREDWWNVSYNERYHPPAAVITAFESYGFAWGGKWPQFDTMHFEYRPEILILNGFEISEN